MRTPPPIPSSVIDAAVRAAHAIENPAYTFVRGGEDSWGFNVASPSGAYRLKIYNKAADLEVRLEATFRLHHEKGFTGVVCPIRSGDSSFTFEVAGRRAAIFPYIFGVPASDRVMSTHQRQEVGRMLAGIHRTDLGDLPIPRERFDTYWGDAAQKVLDAVPAALQSDNRYQRATAELLLPLRATLHAEIERFRTSGLAARQARIPNVLCHGDPISGNILVGSGGIYLIDWDGMCYAPKELDLLHFGDGNPVLHGYADVSGNVALDAGVLGYYQARWNVGEIADFGGRILFEDHTGVQHEHDLAQLRNFLRYSGLDTTDV